MDLSDLNIYAIHIHSEEDAEQVFEYYSRPENGGYTHNTVGSHNCMEFPFLMPSTNDKNDIMGASNYEGWSEKCVEFDEWLDYVQSDASSQEITSAEDIASFIGVLGVGA